MENISEYLDLEVRKQYMVSRNDKRWRASFEGEDEGEAEKEEGEER